MPPADYWDDDDTWYSSTAPSQSFRTERPRPRPPPPAPQGVPEYVPIYETTRIRAPPSQEDVFKHTTISEDQSAGSDLPARLLLALAQKGTEKSNTERRRPRTRREVFSDVSSESSDEWDYVDESHQSRSRRAGESAYATAETRPRTTRPTVNVYNTTIPEDYPYPYEPDNRVRHVQNPFGESRATANTRRASHAVPTPQRRNEPNPSYQDLDGRAYSTMNYTPRYTPSPRRSASRDRSPRPNGLNRSQTIDSRDEVSDNEGAALPEKAPDAEKAVEPEVDLKGKDPSTLGFDELNDYIGMLQGKAQRLEQMQQAKVPRRYQILYRIKHDQASEIFLDHPDWSQGGSSIKSRKPVKNLDLFLERNKDISFLVFRTFNMNNADANKTVTSNTPSDCIKAENPEYPIPHSESVSPVARNLRLAFRKILQSKPEYSSLLQHYESSDEVEAPYLFVYHGRKRWEKTVGRFHPKTQGQLKRFADYVFRFYGEEYTEAETLFSQKMVSPALMKYLFVPGQILVSRKGNDHQGYVTKSWPNFKFRLKDESGEGDKHREGTLPPQLLNVKPVLWAEDDSDSDDNTETGGAFNLLLPQLEHLRKLASSNKEEPDSCTIDTWRWGYDTTFKRQYDKLVIRFPRSKPDHTFHTRPIEIDKLDIYPLRFATEELIEQLKHRGKMFWLCRERSLISYLEQDGDATENGTIERYMVDMKTFQTLHPDNKNWILPIPKSPADEFTAEQLAKDEPPDEHFQYLLPLKIKGYNLRRKKWYDLAADRISPVVWNKKVFETLVMDRKPKELIQALISKQVASEKSTDLIAGKGNGLILLLHGGPGTGKTLTAESVAEIAEKPLYRVTCGDVGTKAEEVEKYLESVLHLGKIWDCVVLLDEADVFLEQRSLEDLQRNALVSVFLRVLEYHEGILILTSNRVGTFDEAFRSRIQLALHYPSLRSFQRQRIWQNFFSRLESFKDDLVNIEDLQDHLEELAKFEMNGRQIRNVITTARQYAEWKNKKLDFEYLKDVIEVSGKFDTYLTKLRGGFTYDQIAEDEGLMLAGAEAV